MAVPVLAAAVSRSPQLLGKSGILDAQQVLLLHFLGLKGHCDAAGATLRCKSGIRQAIGADVVIDESRGDFESARCSPEATSCQLCPLPSWRSLAG